MTIFHIKTLILTMSIFHITTGILIRPCDVDVPFTENSASRFVLPRQEQDEVPRAHVSVSVCFARPLSHIAMQCID
jgi:hypothetical protein